MQAAIFYILALVIVVFSTLTVTSKVILRAAIYLLFVLCATAGLYFMFQYNFLAAVQLTVYGGGIVVLVIFSILLTSRVGEQLEMAGIKKSVFAALASFAGAIMVISVLAKYSFEVGERTQVGPQDIRAVGTQLISTGEKGYVLPFEVISVLLLAAMVAAIVIAKKVKSETDD